MALEELQHAVLLVDRPVVGLRTGDVGVVVGVYAGDGAYEVEFFDGEGQTIAVETLTAEEVAAPRPDQILHIRSLTAA